MITAAEAIRVARSKLGTPYGSGPGQLDCINLIKWVIRHSVGGDPSYTDAHVPALWASYESSGRYRHLVMQHVGIDGAMPGMLAFKGQPLGRDHQPSHVGLVSYNSMVIHASSAKGQVVETELDNGQWTLLGTSAWIAPAATPEPSPDEDPREVYTAQVIALTNDKPVNLRTGPNTSDRVITKVPVGTMVDVLIELDGWAFIDTGREQGYMARQYLQRCDPAPTPEPTPHPDEDAGDGWVYDPIMISDTGAIVRMDGRWRMAID